MDVPDPLRSKKPAYRPVHSFFYDAIHEKVSRADKQNEFLSNVEGVPPVSGVIGCVRSDIVIDDWAGIKLTTSWEFAG